MARKGEGIYKRGNVWWLDCRISGTRYQLPLGKGINRKVALELATAKRAAILRGEAGIARKRKDMPFEKAADEFLAWARANKRPRTAKTYMSLLNQLRGYFGDRTLSGITPFLIEKYKQKRLADGAKVTVNRELACLRSLYNLFIEWKRFEGANPASRFRRAPESQGRLRFLTEDEEARLLAEAEEPLRSVIVVAIHTGLRAYSEALTLTWENIDFQRKTLTVLDCYSKTKESRTVPLNSVALATLKALKARVPGPQVFMTRGRAKSGEWRPYSSFRTAFESACRRANLSGVTPHVLRHTFASRLVMRGVDLRTVMELGGWKNLAMVQRYSHLSQEHKQQAIELLVENSPTIFTTPKSGKPVTPYAPVAQVDRATVS